MRSLNKYLSILSKGNLPVEEFEILTNSNRFNENILNGLRTSNGIRVDTLLKTDTRMDLEKYLNEKTEKWSALVIDRNHLKLKNNDFMLLDEITADLFL